jgi:hypothetical protein
MKTDLTDSADIAMQEPQLTPWQAHALIELGGITGNILEFDECQQIISRLRTIAYELGQLYGEGENLRTLKIAPSNRAEIRALSSEVPADALDYLQFHSPD